MLPLTEDAQITNKHKAWTTIDLQALQILLECHTPPLETETYLEKKGFRLGSSLFGAIELHLPFPKERRDTRGCVLAAQESAWMGCSEWLG